MCKQDRGFKNFRFEQFMRTQRRSKDEDCNTVFRHLLVLGQSSDDPVTVRIGNSEVVNSSEEKLLGAAFKLITNCPLAIMSRNCAKRLAINFTHLLAYRHIWIPGGALVKILIGMLVSFFWV